MNNRPVIGISGTHSTANQSVSIRLTYVGAIVKAGGLPLLLPTVSDEQVIGEMLDQIDGLLLAGGGDVDPARYGEEKQPECNEPDWLRDEFELKITALAKARRMPVFGICRGVQVLNVAYGGTLIQDIENECGSVRAKHYQPEPFTDLWHDVQLTPCGLLERITGLTQMKTNSMHHQAVKTLGGSLVVEGATQDGIIEAISDCKDDGVFGVQFHPEFFAEDHAYAQKLFDYFVGKAKAYHRANL